MANNDFRDGFDVCVGNWGYYSEGELRDTWMHLPIDPDKIEPWLRSHGLVDAEHEETYISDYDGLPFRCPQVFDEYARLDKLNVLAMQLTLLPEGDLAHIQAAIDYGEPLDHLDELMNLMNRGDGELLSCFDFNRYGEIAVNNGYVDLCETCYVNKGGDWPLLDEYSFEEIGGETVAEWRGRVAREKPAAPSETAHAASALAALSADDGAGGTARAVKL